MIEGYRELLPSAPLDAYVHRMAYVYFAFPLPPERLAPDSYVKLSLIFDGEPQYFDSTGASVPWHDGFCGHVPPGQGIIATSDGPVRAMMANFYPSGFHRLFGVPVGRFNGRMVVPKEVLGDQAEVLYHDLRSIDDPERRLQCLEAFLLKRVEKVHTPEPTVMQRVEDHVRATKGMAPVTELAGIANMSVRQLERKAVTELGLSPKAFSSVVRFNHAYAIMQRTRTLDLDVALACGYYDESHLLRDLAYYLGDAPKSFVNLIRPMVDLSLGHQ